MIHLKKLGVVIIIVITAILIILARNTDENGFAIIKDKKFHLISNPDNKDVEEDLMAFAKKKGIKLTIDYADDLEIVDLLESNPKDYDGVWLSNSIWSYMINNVSLTDSKSININPVVFGIKKSKAGSLGFTDGEVYNKEIIDAINSGKLNYVMTSVTKTNTGLISYLGFLNALSGSPEILTKEMLKNPTLEKDLKTLFSGVKRVSGSSSFLEDMFLNSSSYDAVIATESSLIRINKALAESGKETLYLVYPVDGVAVNDSPFAYVDNGQKRRDNFLLLQSFLLSLDEQKALEKLGKRTWYGGVNASADAQTFNREWGIDTTKYLNASKYPSKEVIDEAIIFYIYSLRKPVSIAFCLDYSGSMYGEGEKQLEEAMDFILDFEKSKTEYLQFSEKDKIYVLPFSDDTHGTYTARNGRDTAELINRIKAYSADGGTNLYGCTKDALAKIVNDSDDYTKTVVLMTDGEANYGSFEDLRDYYYRDSRYREIPIYSIMFGNASKHDLLQIANLSNAKVFDGRDNLIGAFKEVRSYN